MIASADLERVDAELTRAGGRRICYSCQRRIVKAGAVRVPHLRAVGTTTAIIDLVACCGARCAARAREAIARREARAAKREPRDRMLGVVAAVARTLSGGNDNDRFSAEQVAKQQAQREAAKAAAIAAELAEQEALRARIRAGERTVRPRALTPGEMGSLYSELDRGEVAR